MPTPASPVIGLETLYLQSKIYISVYLAPRILVANMKRPVPVILSAIFLGLLAALQLLFTVLMVVAGVIFLSKKLPTLPPMPYPPSFLPIMMFAFSLLCAALAVCSIVTLIGLVRLRSCARYSILVIAGCITFFGGILTLTTLAMPLLISSVPTQTPAVNRQSL